jgi:hypothetical protein
MTPADPAQALRDFQPRQKFFVGIDSDGCVFDTMEIKHKECFVPMFIKHFHLQAASKYARQTWEFVNLYSQSRGCNRFPALALSLNHLARRPEVRARQVAVFDTQALEQWRRKSKPAARNSLLCWIGPRLSMPPSPTSYMASRPFHSCVKCWRKLRRKRT